MNWAHSIGYAICFVGALCVAAFLVVNGHPWFAAAVMFLSGMISFKSTNAKK